MTTNDRYAKWRDCDCEACRALAAVSHDKAAWDALYEQTRMQCPNAWATHQEYSDDTQLDMFEVQA